MKGPRVVFTANRGYALTSSRTALIKRFLSSGWNVVLVTADDTESRSLTQIGASLEPIRFNRGGVSPQADITAYRRLCSIYNTWHPSLVQHFHAKPVIMGSIAARRILGESVRVVNTITGLGHAFVSGGIISRLAGVGYSNALAKSDMTIFQNSDDQAMFLGKNWLSKQCARLVPSSGVDTQRFKYLDRTDRDQEVPVIVMLGRLLNQKGLAEFVEVSSRIRELWPKSRFLWAGEEDPIHPDSVSARWMRTREVVEYVGRLSDVLPLLSQADLLLFPSYYREGVPRVVLEAAATGLPTVGFDLPGVREAVRDNETGYLVPFRDVETLTQRVAELLQNKDKRLAMGRAARRMVEKGFDIRVIQEQYFNIYRELGIEV